MRTGLRPLPCTARRLDSIANVLAITLAHLADNHAVCTIDGQRITAVWPNLLAANEQLGSAIDRRDVCHRGERRVRCGALIRNSRRTLNELKPRTRLQIFVNAL